VLLRFAGLAVIVLALTACGGGAKKQAAPAPAGTTTTASDLPPGCTVAEVNTIVNDFLARPTLAPAGSFEVYATYETDGRKFIARKPAKALAQLEQRLRLGEKSRVIELRVGKQDFNHARITFQLTRHAPDFRTRGIHTRLVRGGGTIDCAHQKVAAWVTKGP
jgi:hypothetical protein